MIVLQLNSVCGRGSTGRIAVGIGERLRERGDDSLIAYGRDDAVGWDNAMRVGTKADVIAHQVATRLFDTHAFHSTRATREWIEKVDWDAVDLVHLHNVHGYWLDVEVLFAHLKTLHKPVVWTLHDTWALTGHCAWFEQSGCERWLTGCGHCPQLREYPKSVLLDSSARNWGRKRAAFAGLDDLTLVTPSRWLAEKVSRSHLGGNRTVVIGNEVDVDVFKPTPSDLRTRHGLDGKHVILGVANAWGEAKGLHHLMELVPLLHPDEALVLVGLTEPQVAALPPGVLGITKTADTTELAAWYTAADVFVNPTLEDISSMTNLEAVSVGLPVVTYRTGGAPETVEGMTAVILDDRSARGLRDGIDRMRDQHRPNEGRMQALKAGRRAQADYLDLYDSILGRKGM